VSEAPETPRYYHVTIRVRDALEYEDELFRALFKTDYNDTDAMRTQFAMELAKGRELVPYGFYCDNFDPVEGCQGHETMAAMVKK
jgi:hypothetical protein